jgi:enamine deaminase RidA (YjgF/YER057c/UK114 family)
MPDAAPLFVNPPALARPTGYTQVVETPSRGRTVYVAGQVAWDAQGQLVGPGDFAAQADQVFRNLGAALRDRGGDLSNLVKITTYVLDVANLPAFRQVRDRFIAPGQKVPASTLVEVSKLARPEFLIEIEAVAWLPDA